MIGTLDPQLPGPGLSPQARSQHSFNMQDPLYSLSLSLLWIINRYLQLLGLTSHG